MIRTTFQLVIKLVSANPRVEKKLRNDIHKYCSPGKELTVDTVDKMEYLEMVIKEALRLYPPAPTLIPRDVERPFSIAGVPLFKGDIILISPYLTQRLVNINDPDQFIPERFSKNENNQFNRNQFIPFGKGQHECIGQRFALQELKLLLGALYKEYDIVVDNVEQSNLAVHLEKGALKLQYPPIARFFPVNRSLSEEKYQELDTRSNRLSMR